MIIELKPKDDTYFSVKIDTALTWAWGASDKEEYSYIMINGYKKLRFSSPWVRRSWAKICRPVSS